MSSSRQTVLTQPGMGGRAISREQRQSHTDAGEWLLAELAARRVQLQELLGWIRSEVDREMASQRPSHMPCRRLVKPRLRAAR
jgi:hypothetical protein